MSKSYRHTRRGDFVANGILFRDVAVTHERGRTTVHGRNGARWVIGK